MLVRLKLALLTAITILAINVAAAEATFPGRNGKVAFNPSSNSLWFARADGTHERRFARGSDPAFSPSGRRVAFVRSRSGGSDDLFVKPTRRGPVRRLTRGGFRASDPTFTANENAIIFARFSRDGNTGFLYSVRLKGSRQPRKLAQGLNPTTSVDGQTIVFDRDGDIFRMNRDGSDVVNLTRTPAKGPLGSFAFEGGPDVAPDGQRITYATSEGGPLPGSNRETISTMTIDGADRRIVAETRDVETGLGQPIFVPDGEFIAFQRSTFDGFRPSRGGRLVRPDGTGERRFPVAIEDWSPRPRRKS